MRARCSRFFLVGIALLTSAAIGPVDALPSSCAAALTPESPSRSTCSFVYSGGALGVAGAAAGIGLLRSAPGVPDLPVPAAIRVQIIGPSGGTLLECSGYGACSATGVGDVPANATLVCRATRTLGDHAVAFAGGWFSCASGT